MAKRRGCEIANGNENDMRSGMLRHRINLQTATQTPDAAGQLSPTWSTTYANEPAEVIETGGGEAVRGQQIDATATHLVRIRYRAGITELMRIVWGTRTLNVINARDLDGRRRELWVACKESKP
jgi:SPP1 family predicted phage head-tail adaptor